MIRCSILAALLLPVSACSVSQDEEVALGHENAAQVNAQLPIVTDPAISSYIQDLGQSIAKGTRALLIIIGGPVSVTTDS